MEVSTKYLTIKEVAERLGVSIMSVNRWLKSGKLVGYKFGKSVRINEEDFEQFIKNNRIDNNEKSDFSTGKSVLKHWGTWVGSKEEYFRIIKAIKESRSDAEF
ncbi:helix-turn-helix domain-containing protein [Candidatus Poribacteria bacterium]|nr:helix-turn-helix domain-containing protein [Candidatus Poribacteria bacterium]